MTEETCATCGAASDACKCLATEATEEATPEATEATPEATEATEEATEVTPEATEEPAA